MAMADQIFPKQPEPQRREQAKAEAPSTSSVLWAEWRRGLKDLQNAVLNPWNGVTQTHEEQGTIANPTPHTERKSYLRSAR
jgi:hypothetical protein